MNLLIAGCGTIGAQLAKKMSNIGHAVAVIDHNPDSFERLGSTFNGFTVVGNTIDLDLLRKAGIESCDAVAAMTSSDNVNVMVSQLAKEVFGIKHVLTRIYDTNRAKVFSQFGLRTICPTSLIVDSAVSALTERDAIRHVSIGGHTFCLSLCELPERSVGKSAVSIKVDSGDHPVGLLHSDGTAELFCQNTDVTAKINDKLLLMHIV